MANQFLSLSLFVMLLSFFIVLNALSNFEEVKSRPVLNSISLAFSSKNIVDEQAPSFEDSSQMDFNDGDALDKLEALFKSQITGYKINKNRLGTVMHVSLPVRSFERAVKVAAKSDQPGAAQRNTGNFFLPTLISLMQSEQAGIIYRMDMVLNVPGKPATIQNQAPREMSQYIAQVGSYSRRLEEAGLPKKLMSAGIAEGKKGYIDLYFRRYEAFNPLGEARESQDANPAGETP